MTIKIIDETVNIDLCPVADLASDLTITEITIGDLHANAVKFLYFLVRHGICTISNEDYNRFVEIYRTPVDELTRKIIDEFNAIVGNIGIIKQDILVRLIGDEVGDRGDDYTMLKLMEKLDKSGVKVEKLASNHGAEFIEAYERFAERYNKFEITMLNIGHAASLARLAALIDKGLVGAKEVFEIVNTVYKPNLKLISYSLAPDKNEITIFSHAGIGLEVIKALAKKFGVEYKDTTMVELALTIDLINQHFSEYVCDNRVHELYEYDEMMNGYDGNIPFTEDNAVEFTLWNREYDSLDRPAKHNGYNLNFAHGHDYEHTRGNIYGLDSVVGKNKKAHLDRYVSMVSDDIQSQKLFGSLHCDTIAQQHFKEKLITINQKGQKLFKAGHAKAAATAFVLYTKLQFEFMKYVGGELPKNEFKEVCVHAINVARPELEIHRGWKQLLGNLALAIVGLGIGYVIAGLIHKRLTGQFLFFRTDSAHKLDELHDALEQEVPTAFAA